ncbi:MAG TPA: Asp-tRNA(Asn)/Glu-tRNA(Gln) amidotransferase subunit GatB [Candidatus Paceibacterota bacterium]|nr:Asp-tRNA(Asn)/Glu-tRNA(Gln) amidotransferase subunit GatB [Candidatus Paceibacterota bacterium]
MKEYVPTIGLEIHAELKTKAKMFCESRNDPDEKEPNVHICPTCLAHPGTLPTINKEAVRHVLRVGTALGGTLADYSEFDRKSYFYPDIPKGYQISQYQHPLVSGGLLNDVAITRVHLEEDTARSTHHGGKSLVDFNRAGVPLMELVTEPVIHDAKTAGDFARELQLLLRTLGVSDANLEKGEMRIEANISVSNTDSFGTKVEVKNLNSFRSVERAIEYEVKRQAELLRSGGAVVQETRGWNEAKQETFHQRFKEGSADYRYFPEPDLPKMKLSEIPEFSAEELRASLPELPWERRARYEALGIKREDSLFLGSSIVRSNFFDAVLRVLENSERLAQLAANYITSDLAGYYAKSGTSEYEKISPEALAGLVRMLAENKLSSRGAKDALLVLAQEGGTPEAVVEARGLAQVSDRESLRPIVQEMLQEQAGVVEDYRKGKEVALKYLVGQAMKVTKGAGNPALLQELILEEVAK